MSIEGEPNTGGMDQAQLEQALKHDEARRRPFFFAHEDGGGDGKWHGPLVPSDGCACGLRYNGNDKLGTRSDLGFAPPESLCSSTRAFLDGAEKAAEPPTARDHEEQQIQAKEEKLDALLSTLDKATSGDIKAHPEAWPLVCQVANLALELSLAIGMAELAEQLGIDVAWIAGLPALIGGPAPSVPEPERSQAIGIGDVVKLRGQARRMTVENIVTAGVECVWFTEDGDLKRHTFPPAALLLG